MKSDAFKGYFFVVVATLAFSNVYIFSKAALNELPLAQFGSLWYSVVATACFLFAWFNKKLGQIAKLTRSQVRILLLLGLLEIFTTSLFFLSIYVIPDPSVTSFLGNMFPVMVMLGGIFIFHERFGPIEVFGGFLALAGAFVISYNGGTTLDTLFIKGTGLVFFNSIFAATATLVVKAHVKKLSPELLNLNRSVWLLFFSGVMFFVLGDSAAFSARAVTNTAIGAFLEFLAILTVYYSFKYIEVSRSAIVQSLKGIFVLLMSFLVFRILPLPHQIVGGIITVGGILIMAMAQAGLIKWRAMMIRKRKR